jgi:hypothetical protein
VINTIGNVKVSGPIFILSGRTQRVGDKQSTHYKGAEVHGVVFDEDIGNFFFLKTF